jgi:hypothetical protein
MLLRAFQPQTTTEVKKVTNSDDGWWPIQALFWLEWVTTNPDVLCFYPEEL